MRATGAARARLTLRVDLGEDRAIGPGKIRLLEAIRDTGSITKAGIALGMSYRRAWLLVDDMNHCLRCGLHEHATLSALPNDLSIVTESFQAPSYEP